MQNQFSLVKGINRQQMLDISTARGEGAFALDHRGCLLFLNSEAERMLGWQLNDLKEKNFFTAANFKMEAIASIGASNCAALKSVGCSHLQQGASITCKNGTVLAIIYISLPVFDNGRMYGKVFVFKEKTRSEHTQNDELLDACGSIVVKLDLGGKVVYCNDFARQRFADKVADIIPTEIRATIRGNPEQLVRHSALINRCKGKNGAVSTVAWSVNPLRESNGRVVGAVCVGNDISEYDSRPKDLVPEKVLAEKVFARMSDGVITIDPKGVVEYLNPMAEQMTGWSRSDAQGLLVKDVFHCVSASNRQSKIDALISSANVLNENNEQISAVLLRRDGWEFNVEASSTLLRDAQGMVLGSAIIFRDISDLHGINRWMGYESSHDALTGLINRSEFESHVTQALTSARTDGRQHALCFIDIDDFRSINQAYDMLTGDEVLKQIAVLLHGKVRESDVLARIGDDEFGVLLMNCSLEKAQETAESFCSTVRKHSFIWEGHELDLGISVGLAPITSSSGGLADIMRIADSACFVAKDKGRGRVHIYKAQEISSHERHGELQWIQRIRESLDDNRFRLYCQSIVPLQHPESRPVHHEILLRMLDETGDVIRPGAFLGSAERYNLMPSIDRWVVQNALSMLGERFERSNDRGEKLGVFALNLSAQSLDDENFLGFVIDQFDKTEFPASNICFEITESTAIANLMSATRFMSIMRGMGCRFALDDFGRGFSSYAYLKNLPVDYLKIDGSFIRDVANDPVDLAMVESINQIGHIMGVQTIAEFVESEEALEKLISLGVDHVQGYQLGKPRPMWHSFNDAKVV